MSDQAHLTTNQKPLVCAFKRGDIEARRQNLRALTYKANAP